MYSDRRGYGQKSPRTTPSRQKTPGQKPPDKSPREQLRENLYRGLLPGFFVLGLLKIGGPRCVTYIGGVPGCVTKCDRGGGSKLAKINCVTYFMDGPCVGLHLSETTNSKHKGRRCLCISLDTIITPDSGKL